MAQTLADVVVTPTWQSINTTTGLAVGTKLSITNKSTSPMVIAEGTQPASDNKDGVPLAAYTSRIMVPEKVVLEGSLEIWIRVTGDTSQGKVAVQDITEV